MKRVKDLIAELEKYDPDEPVVLWGCNDDRLTNVAFVEERVTVRSLEGRWSYDGTKYVEIVAGGPI